jgi:hypothetical protein
MLLAAWAALYLRRADLRKMMLTMSALATPLALFDLIFVPSYWKPVTLFHVPIGIEGFLYSFCIGGIAAVLYAELNGRTSRGSTKWRNKTSHAIWILAITTITFVAAYALHLPNPALIGDAALAAGVVAMLVLRRDLARSSLVGSLAFGVVYFVLLKIWVLWFPEVHGWFTFQHLPKLFIWGTPGWEIVFGFLFGAYWSGLYEALFGYELVPLKSSTKRPRK